MNHEPPQAANTIGARLSDDSIRQRRFGRFAPVWRDRLSFFVRGVSPCTAWRARRPSSTLYATLPVSSR